MENEMPRFEGYSLKRQRFSFNKGNIPFFKILHLHAHGSTLNRVFVVPEGVRIFLSTTIGINLMLYEKMLKPEIYTYLNNHFPNEKYKKIVK